MPDEQRKTWRGRLLATGEGRIEPVDEDQRPHAQVTQGLAAMRRAQRPTLRRVPEPPPDQGVGVHRFPPRRQSMDTAPGRPPGDPPGPDSAPPSAPFQEADLPVDTGWGTPPPAPEPATDELVTLTRGQLEQLVSEKVAEQLAPVAQAISDMKAALLGAPKSDAQPQAEEVLAEPVALPVLLDDLPEREPVAELPVPEDDWTQGKSAEFAAAPAQAAT